MSTAGLHDETPVRSIDDLVEFMGRGCRPPERWRIGTEHEKLVFRTDTLQRPPFEGPRGIAELLTSLARFGWSVVTEDDRPIALARADGSTISLEPGGQLELSGALLQTLHETCREIHEHLDQVREVGRELGLGVIGLGFDPLWSREQVPWMPRRRHAIMRNYMPRRGALGLDMMTRTCTVQVNLDYASEADMVAKMRVSVAVQPVVTAMFANSPFVEGRACGHQSHRAHVWRDTDPDRAGLLPFVFDSGMGFARYVQWALDVPMYFVRRGDAVHDVAGQSFRAFLQGRLDALPGERPTLGDFADHLSTLFPDVRLRPYLEQRGADAGSWADLCALPALWTGLLYDADAFAELSELVSGWSFEAVAQLREAVPRHGLQATLSLGRRRVAALEVARKVVAISRRGLERRARADGHGRTEAHFLDGLRDQLARGSTPSDRWLALHKTGWKGDVRRIYDYAATSSGSVAPV